MSVVTVYTTDPCARCLTAKALLARRGISYSEINLAKDPDGRAELAGRTGMTTSPRSWSATSRLGGSTICSQPTATAGSSSFSPPSFP
jgi:glutaredoxin 3